MMLDAVVVVKTVWSPLTTVNSKCSWDSRKRWVVMAKTPIRNSSSRSVMRAVSTVLWDSFTKSRYRLVRPSRSLSICRKSSLYRLILKSLSREWTKQKRKRFWLLPTRSVRTVAPRYVPPSHLTRTVHVEVALTDGLMIGNSAITWR